MPKPKDRDGVCVRKGKFYISWIDATGRRRHRKTAAYTLQQARALRAAELHKADETRTRGITEPSRDTCAEFFPRYLRYQKARLTPHAYARTRGIVEQHLQSHFGGRRLADIRRADIDKYLTARNLEVSAGSVIKEANCLKHVLNMAVAWELIPYSPAAQVRLPRQPAGRLRYLQPAEFAAVWQACSPWLRPIVALLVFTGMRRGELLAVRWLDVDLAGGRLLLPQSKNGKGRVVWLNENALRVVQALPKKHGPTDRIFSPESYSSPENVSLSFLRACRRCKIENFRLHDLRHTAASWMRMAGADIHTVAKLLGHSVKQAERYQHLSPVYLAEAARGLDAALGPELDKLPAWQEQTAAGEEIAERDSNAINPINQYLVPARAS